MWSDNKRKKRNLIANFVAYAIWFLLVIAGFIGLKLGYLTIQFYNVISFLLYVIGLYIAIMIGWYKYVENKGEPNFVTVICIVIGILFVAAIFGFIFS